MIRRLTSLLVSIILVFTVTAAAFAVEVGTAADGEISGDKAPVTLADTAAREDTVPSADEPEQNEHLAIAFDADSAGWFENSTVGFHIAPIGGGSFFELNSVDELGDDEDGDGIWIYDLTAAGVELSGSAQYTVVFYTDLGDMTYELVFDSSCAGDTAYCDMSDVFPYPDGSARIAYLAYWTNADPAVNGPIMAVSSIGNVVGSCLPRSVSAASLLYSFLKNYMDTARAANAISDQEIIDIIGTDLGLTAEEAKRVVDSSRVITGWRKAESPLPTMGSEAGKRGDADDDGDLTVLDATRIQRYLAGLILDYDLDLSAADIDRDNDVTIVDVTRIQRVLASLCDVNGDPLS